MIALALAGCAKSGGKKQVSAANNEASAANKPDDMAIEVTAGNNTRNSEKDHKPVWEVSWQRAHLLVINGRQSGTMLTVTGKLYGKDGVASTFSGERAEADQAQDRLIIEGSVKITSLDSPKAVLTAKKVEWIPDLQVLKASGDVTVEGDNGVVGPIQQLYASSDLKKVGTSQDYFKK
ncbi:MAG: LPS export ABC transporter periplasmic protein LptC [Armatimonadetes bacterium]|nr:LPS export ABC transporter periplasmic protein LptC [Armatimonadota bacterium]